MPDNPAPETLDYLLTLRPVVQGLLRTNFDTKGVRFAVPSAR